MSNRENATDAQTDAYLQSNIRTPFIIFPMCKFPMSNLRVSTWQLLSFESSYYEFIAFPSRLFTCLGLAIDTTASGPPDRD